MGWDGLCLVGLGWMSEIGLIGLDGAVWLDWVVGFDGLVG